MSRQCHIRSRYPKGISHHKLSFDIEHLNILFAVLKKNVLKFLVSKNLEKKLLTPQVIPLRGRNSTRLEAAILYMHKKSVPGKFFENFIKIYTALLKYKYAELAFSQHKASFKYKNI